MPEFYFRPGFKEKIKARRSELGMTLEQVAEKAGVRKSTVMRWENGDIHIARMPSLSKLAKALDVALPYLLGLSEHKDAIDIYVSASDTPLNEKEKIWLQLYRELGENTIKMICTAAKGFEPEMSDLLNKLIS